LRDADEAIELRRAQRFRVFDRLAYAVLEFSDAVGMASDAALSPFPVARGKLCSTSSRRLRSSRARISAAGKHTETGIRRHETRRGGGVEALEEVELVVQHRQLAANFGMVAKGG
jgi:hypothetical protein